VKPFKAFILAAGFGERLRPLTDYLPKPLLPILGKPIIEKVLDNIRILSPEGIGMNACYKWEMLRDWIHACHCAGDVAFFREEEILGTGGALRNARSFLSDAPFLVHNSDILSDLRINDLIASHLESGNVVTLAVHDNQSFKNVWIDGEGQLHAVGTHAPRTEKELRAVAFTGIAAYSPELLDFLPMGRSSVVDAWLSARRTGKRVGTVDFTGCGWTDIGTPGAYASTIFATLQQSGDVFHVDPAVECRGLVPGANTVIEKGCRIEGKASLRDCILLPGAIIPDGAAIADSLVGPGYVLPIRSTRTLPSSLSPAFLAHFLGNSWRKHDISLIGAGGSDRNYYRVRDREKSAVLMVCPEDNPDLHRHLAYTEFFRKHAVPVPQLLSADAAFSYSPSDAWKARYALFEDLGDVSLYSWLKCRRARETKEALYRKTLDILAHLHSAVSGRISDCPPLGSRLFDYEHFRWETAYFCDSFVLGLLGIALPEREELDREFDRLARSADSFAKSIVHRDFQSQNIMVTGDDIPRVIDYQGARIGPPGYDLASLLWDPYHRLDDAMRERLMDYYISLMKECLAGSFAESAFRQSLLPCRLQRHMQALGAYGFLSKVKGKTYFEKYIPQALHYLNEEVEAAAKEYPVLFNLIMRRIDEKTDH
jgi:NDP-sugar pyrophosphorylase family protein/aminoglycoside/choline kinase family phosphotransferase